MVVEIALGADPPVEIAWRYGLTADEYEQLEALEWFVELIARKRQELQDNGYLFQAKAAMMAEALLTSLFQQAMAQKVAAPVAIEISKQLVDIGRLKPVPGVTTPGGGGPGFAINIQINQGDATTPLVVTEGRPGGIAAPPAPDAPPTLEVDFKPVAKPQGPLLPKPPAYISNLTVPNLDRACRPSLAGTPATQAAVAAAQAAVPVSSPGGTVGLPRKP
jgi:hypothetical protein